MSAIAPRRSPPTTALDDNGRIALDALTSMLQASIAVRLRGWNKKGPVAFASGPF